MSFDTARQLIDQILTDDERTKDYYSSKNSPGVCIEFIGGEPLLEIKLIDQIVDYFISKCIELRHHWATRYMISFATNGLLYFEEDVQHFIQKNRRHLSLSVSIDGNKELHDACRVDLNGNGTYDRAIAAVRHYKSHWGNFMGSKVTISPDNVQYTSDAIISMIEEGYDGINFNVVNEEGWTVDHAKIYYRELKKLSDYLLEHDTLDDITINALSERYGHPIDVNDNTTWCGGSGAMLSIDYKGDLFPCIRYMESSLNGNKASFDIGNINDGIAKTAETADRLNLLSQTTRRSMSDDKCFNCPIAFGCATCTAYCYEMYGLPIKRTTFTCDMMKARALGLSYLWNSYYRKKCIDVRYALDIPDEWALEIIDIDELNILKELAKEV
jgi:radical SAM peptide maturase (CXXX-repeat target family)